MQNTGLDGSQARIKIAGRNIHNLRYADDTTLMAESEEELKRLLMTMKEESEKAGLKLNIQKTKVIASNPTTSWKIERKMCRQWKIFIFLVIFSKITADGDYSHEVKRHLLLGKVMKNLDSILKGRNFADKGSYIQSYGFSSCLVQIWELDHKEDWVPTNLCFWITVLNKTLESFLDWRKSKPVNPKGNQPWIFIGRTDAEAPILWPPDAKSWPIGEDPEAWKDWGQEEKRTTEDQMIG